MKDGTLVRRRKEEETAEGCSQFISRRFGRKRSVRSIALAIPAERKVVIRVPLRIREADRGLGSTLRIRKAEPKTPGLPKTGEIAEEPKLRDFECSLKLEATVVKSAAQTQKVGKSLTRITQVQRRRRNKSRRVSLTFKTQSIAQTW